MEKLIDIEHVTAAYGNKTVLRDISLTVWKDDFLGIIGPNGGGKTTLLKVILGLLPPVAGTIRFYEAERPVPSLRIGYLPQLNNIDKKFPISVREVVASGLASEKRLFRSYSASQKQRVEEVLEKWGWKIWRAGRSANCPADNCSACCWDVPSFPVRKC